MPPVVIGPAQSFDRSNEPTEANKVQRRQVFTAAAAGNFGTVTTTVGRTVGLGTPRQMQLAFRLNFWSGPSPLEERPAVAGRFLG